jgi:hypothetical protein
LTRPKEEKKRRREKITGPIKLRLKEKRRREIEKK